MPLGVRIQSWSSLGGAAAAGYVALVFVELDALLVFATAATLGMSLAFLGLNIGHDANHGVLFRNPSLNFLASHVFDVLGGSSYLWRRKHNDLHHPFTGLDGWDQDINLGRLARLASDQPRRGHHSYQHIYMWALYCLLVVKWQWVDDYRTLLRGKIGGQVYRRPSGRDLVCLLAGKVAFFSWVFWIPSLYHSLTSVLTVYFVASVFQSLVLSLVFQVAHCTVRHNGPVRFESCWVERQVRETANFGSGVSAASWWFGGLNLQIEHHLFPRIAHENLPRVAPFVRQICREFGVSYNCSKSFISALHSHQRWLVEMGRSDSTTSVGLEFQGFPRHGV